MERVALWLRWSARDLRARWVQVAAIAAIIAIGTGLYAGLSSTSLWRRDSYDRSFASLDTHDIRIALTAGTYADRGRLLSVLRSVDSHNAVAAAVERLAVPTQVDASVPGKTILASGRIVGVDVGGGGPSVDRVAALNGRTLEGIDDGLPNAVLDVHFAKHYDLPASGTVRVGANVALTYVGHGEAPEQFLVLTDSGSLYAEATFATVYTSLTTAEAISGKSSAVNEVVLTLHTGFDRRAVAAELAAGFASTAPDLAVEVTTIDNDRVYRYLYDDIDGDQRFFNIFASLVLVGAAFAAFNLTGRMVEAQRREIGIGMALGVRPRSLALRPLLFAAEVTLLGAALGTLVGLGIDALMKGVLKSFVPLPVWRTAFQAGVFARGAALGLALPLVATIWPVVRAVRVAPIEALRTGHLAKFTRGLSPLLRIVRLPGRSVGQMPIRDIIRAPRRTLLTALGIASAVATLVAVIGIVDTFLSTIDRGEQEILAGDPSRMTVDLDGFYPLGSGPTRAVEDAATVATTVPMLVIGGTLSSSNSTSTFDVRLTLLDFTNPLWVPTATKGALSSSQPGLVLSAKAANDLHATIGDEVTLRHPLRDGTGYSMVDSPVEVIAIHPNPYRFVAFMDIRFAGLMNLTGIVNSYQITPKPGATSEAVQRELFGTPGVAAALPVTAVVRAIRDFIGEIVDILDVARGAVVLLVLLIAFNSSSISADERRRQHATMFAFGLPVRRVMSMAIVESLVVGLIGTAFGIGLGYALVQWISRVMIPDTLPELGVTAHIASGTLWTATVLGVVAVAVAPVLTLRRMLTMRIPETLRVQE